MLNVVQHLFLNANKNPNQTKPRQPLKTFKMVCLSRPYPFKFFKGCFPQILLGPFLNTLSHMKMFFLHGST